MRIIGKKNMGPANVLLATLISSALLLTACGAGPTDPATGAAGSSTNTGATDTGSTVASTSTTGAVVTTAGGTGVTSTPTPGSPTPTPTPGTPTPTPTPKPTPTPSTGSLGKTAWSNNCAACHGSQTSKGANASNIMAAIAANTGGMGVLNGRISSTDASNIAVYAANPGAY